MHRKTSANQPRQCDLATLHEVVTSFADEPLVHQWFGDPSDTEDDCVPLAHAFTSVCRAASLEAYSVRLHPAVGADHDFHAVSVVHLETKGGPLALGVDWTARQFDNVEHGLPFELIGVPLLWRATPDIALSYPLPFVSFAASSHLAPGEPLAL